VECRIISFGKFVLLFIGVLFSNMTTKSYLNFVTDCGADPTGVATSDAAAAYVFSNLSNPGKLYVPPGKYTFAGAGGLQSGIGFLVPYGGVEGAGVSIEFDNAVFQAKANNISLFRWADCFGSTTGVLTLSTGGYTGISAYEIMPQLGNANTAVTNQNFNSLMHTTFLGDTAGYLQEGITFMAGIPISNVGSGCWYNDLGPVIVRNSLRAVHFKDNGSTSAYSSGSNSNRIYSIKTNGEVNTVVQIDAGGGNKFPSFSAENVNYGTTPNTTPAGIIVNATMANGGANPENSFCAHFENVNQHVNINDPTTRFYDSDFDPNLSVFPSTFSLGNNGELIEPWTPNLTATSGSLTLDYANCQSVKRGNQVTITGYMRVHSTSSPSGRLYINGLKYAPVSTLQNRTSVSIWWDSYGTTVIPAMAWILEGTNQIELAQDGTVGGFANLIVPYADFTINSTYLTAS
jgi:hypothetical protein